MLINMIGRHNLKNKLIIAFVIAICLSILLYHYGVIDFANAITPAAKEQSEQKE